MNDSHILVEMAYVYDAPQTVEDPSNSRYDNILGAWIWGGENQFLVKSTQADRPRPTTKKQDMETGEDLKGA